jgi:hypothetical protein
MVEAAIGRREFVRRAVGGAAALWLPATVRPRAKVFDMGRGPRRRWGPRAMIYDDLTGAFVRELPVDLPAGGGWLVRADWLPVGSYRMAIIDDRPHGMTSYHASFRSPGPTEIAWQGLSGVGAIARLRRPR